MANQLAGWSSELCTSKRSGHARPASSATLSERGACPAGGVASKRARRRGAGGQRQSVFSVELEKSALSSERAHDLRRRHVKDIEQDVQARRQGLERREWYQGEDLSWRGGSGAATDGRGVYGGSLGPVSSPSAVIEASGLSQERQLTLQERNAGDLERDVQARRRALQQKQWYQGEDLSWRGGGTAGGKKDAYTELMGWAKGKEAERLKDSENRLLSLGVGGPAGVNDGGGPAETPATADSGVQARRTSIYRATGAAPPVVGLPPPPAWCPRASTPWCRTGWSPSPGTRSRAQSARAGARVGAGETSPDRARAGGTPRARAASRGWMRRCWRRPPRRCRRRLLGGRPRRRATPRRSRSPQRLRGRGSRSSV